MLHQKKQAKIPTHQNGRYPLSFFFPKMNDRISRKKVHHCPLVIFQKKLVQDGKKLGKKVLKENLTLLIVLSFFSFIVMIQKNVMNKRLMLKSKNMKYVLLNTKRAVVVVLLPVHLLKVVKVHQKHHQAKNHPRNLQEKKQQLKQHHLMKMMMMMTMKMKNKLRN